MKSPNGRVAELFKSEFLPILVLGLYVWAFATSPSRALKALWFGAKTFGSVALIILSVFMLIGLVQVFLDKKRIAQQLGHDAGWKAVLLAVGFGSILVGPVYVVFPLLKEIREHGARWAVIVAVLTAWAVKLPMVPLEVKFLGWKFSLARAILTVLSAFVLGVVIERLMGREKVPAED